MRYIKVFAIIIVILIISCNSNNQYDQLNLIKIEVLPNDSIIYKISDDLNFENWNFGISVKGLDSNMVITSLIIKHYSGDDQIYLVEYSGNTLVNFLKKKNKDESLYQNFHIMLPESSSADKLSLEIFSNNTSLGKKSVELIKYKQQNQYKLPIKGTWFVSSGYDFGIEHRRHLSRGHFACDFVRINEKGFISDGPELEDNYSFGQPVLAPAPGVVIDLHEGEQDSQPGSHNLSKKANYIEIDHGNGEISRAVHLQKGSIKVSVEDSVFSGQIIASVGNSGFSDSPHLHFGFHQNIIDDKGNIKQIPIPILFSNYRVSWNQGTDHHVPMGRPRRGQFIRPDSL